jgi:hypothetical protein
LLTKYSNARISSDSKQNRWIWNGQFDHWIRVRKQLVMHLLLVEIVTVGKNY